MLMTVFGKRGSGKTTLIRALLPTLKKPVVVIDILGNYADVEGPDVVHCNDHIEGLQALLSYLSTKDKPDVRPGMIIIRATDVNVCVDYMCSALWHAKGGTLVVDEADAIREPDAPCFDEAIRYGRNRGIDIITGCRRPAEISRNVTAGADIAYCLSTQEPRDIIYYTDFLGEDMAMRLQSLPQYQGIYKDFKNQAEGTFKTDSTGKIIILSHVKLGGAATSNSARKEKPSKQGKEPLTVSGQTKPDQKQKNQNPRLGIVEEVSHADPSLSRSR